MNSVVTFTFDDHSIRVVKDRRGGFWVVGRDICLAHGLKNPNLIMRSRWKDAVAKLLLIKDRMGRDAKVRVLNATEAVNLIQGMQARQPAFEHWFVHEVLPQLERPLVNPKEVKSGVRI
jgi:prophage antirepressor-like protein